MKSNIKVNYYNYLEIKTIVIIINFSKIIEMNRNYRYN